MNESRICNGFKLDGPSGSRLGHRRVKPGTRRQRLTDSIVPCESTRWPAMKFHPTDPPLAPASDSRGALCRKRLGVISTLLL